ncbi:MAG: hypothetical protein MUP85_07635, partial [Candidatus Lokiarchaeota archaeon]|nr:hypothetical protein [Candidatus Lokiarchaeota archaeon]
MCKNLKIIIAIFLLLLMHFQLTAQRSGEFKGFYGSINLGLGIVEGNITSEEKNSSSQFAMHFNVGLFVTKTVQVGITLNGWLFESYGSIPFAFKGESISNGMLHLQFYPVNKYRIFLKGAYGISEYTNLRPDKDHGNGSAFMVALGYEKEIGKRNFLPGIQLSYNLGKLKYTDLS